MPSTQRLVRAAMESDDALRQTLSTVIREDLGLTIAGFAEESQVSPSTLYKILSGDRAPSLDTLRQILAAVQDLRGEAPGEFIAVIAARHVLDKIEERRMRIGGELVTIREYPATSVEEAIIAGVRAERDGATALVCAPIVSSTVEKVLSIPVATIMPRESVTEAIKLAAKKRY